MYVYINSPQLHEAFTLCVCLVNYVLLGQYVDMEDLQLCIILLPVKSLLYVCLQEFKRHKNKQW